MYTTFLLKMTKNIKFTDEALKQIEKKLFWKINQKNSLELPCRVEVVQGLNIIFLLTKKLERMTLFLIKQLLTSNH